MTSTTSTALLYSRTSWFWWLDHPWLISDTFLLETVEASLCYFFVNWFMKLKCPNLLKSLGTLIQENYQSFYPSEPSRILRFDMRHPVASALECCAKKLNTGSFKTLPSTRTPKCETCQLRLIFNFAQPAYFCKASLNTRTHKYETCKLRLIFNFAVPAYFCKTSFWMGKKYSVWKKHECVLALNRIKKILKLHLNFQTSIFEKNIEVVHIR